MKLIQTSAIQHKPVSTASAANRAESTASSAFGGQTGYSWLTHQAGQSWRPYPVQPVRTEIRFGMVPHPYCGVCPICVAGAAARAEVAKIGQLRQGDDLDEDLEISVGQASSFLRSEGKETGAKVGRASIGNEDGTRLQPFAARDLEIYSIAALPRAYTADSRTRYTISGNPSKPDGGTNNGLYRAVIGGQILTPEKDGETFSYSALEGDPPPPPENPRFPLLGKFKNESASEFGVQVKTYGIYHHVAEGAEVRTSKHSWPLLLGYVAMARPKQDELMVVSLRELPRFEHLGIEAGGLMNALGLAAKEGDIDAVSLLVEPWQEDLKLYINDLRDKYGFGIEETNIAKVSGDYRKLIDKLQVPADSQLVRIPLGKLKQTYAELSAKQAQGKLDGDLYTELLNSIALPDAIRDASCDIPPSGRRLENVPKADEITLLEGDDPEIPEGELFVPELPDFSGFQEE